MTKHRPVVLACVVTLAISSLAWSEQVTFKVKHQLRASPDSTRLWWLVESGGDLVLDDSARTITVRTKPNPLDIGFDAVEKVIFDPSYAPAPGLA